ncbi:MAG TPA: response regulator [Holophagaceae bacterium]|jgi:two-component system cell cycle response regulator DivK|nr:response regulator [Holophagaceae bacterium]
MAQRILIVEDDPINIRYMQVVLTRKGGYEVAVSEDVEEILRMAREDGLTCIIMDVSLTNSQWGGEKVDGVFITKLLKADAEAAKVPVMLATAHAMSGDREKFMRESGAEGYLSKPIHDPDAFIKAVREVVDKQP